MLAFIALLFAVFWLGATLGFIMASVFCPPTRRRVAPMFQQPAPSPPPVSTESAPSEIETISQIFREAGLELVDGEWTAPNAPYVRRIAC